MLLYVEEGALIRRHHVIYALLYLLLLRDAAWVQRLGDFVDGALVLLLDRHLPQREDGPVQLVGAH